MYKNKSITIFIYVPNNIGGIYDMTSSLADELIKRNYNIVKFCNIIQLFLNLYKYRSSVRFSILSLHSGLYSIFFSKSIYILHGFPIYPQYSFIKSFIINFIPKYVKFFNGKLVAVSHFVYDINSRIFKICVDDVIHNGLSNLFLDNLNLFNKIKKRRLLYLGIISLNKGLDTLIQGFINSKLFNNYDFIIAGTGPDLEFLKNKYINYQNIKFVGYIDGLDKVNLYVESEIFLSLNNMEPFGITYLEAYSCCCKILGPYNFGASEVLPSNTILLRVHDSEMNNISFSLETLASLPVPSRMNLRNFSYNIVAQKYLKMLDL